MPYETGAIRVAHRGAVRILRIDRPATLNALDRRLGADLLTQIRAADADDTVGAIVVTGTGRAFCSGGDLQEMASTASPAPSGGAIALDLFDEPPQTPLIAAVNGLAYGGGLQLAMACDIVVAAEEATFAMPELRWGLVATAHGTTLLTTLVGPRRALDLLLTGEPVSAPTACAWGLVSRVVPGPDLLGVAIAMATLASSWPLEAVRLTKQLVRESLGGSAAELAEVNGRFAALAADRLDSRAGVAAFAGRTGTGEDGR